MGTRGLSGSFKAALAGVVYCLRTQRNMRIHFLVAVLVLYLGYVLQAGIRDLLFLFFAVTLVLVAEMINTAMETLVDLYTRDYHPLAGVAKDVAAGAVLIAALNAFMVGLIIFYPLVRRYMP